MGPGKDTSGLFGSTEGCTPLIREKREPHRALGLHALSDTLPYRSRTVTGTGGATGMLFELMSVQPADEGLLFSTTKLPDGAGRALVRRAAWRQRR
ncbi:MAG TPA: hypothetical protein DFS52_12525 [Myxococcales bacterium]|nr:hypothetical protein [Myxococcales bacterium]